MDKTENCKVKKVLITGANGFIGHALMAHLSTWRKWNVTGSVRSLDNTSSPSTDLITVGNINGHTNWSQALADVSIVIHCAAISSISDISDTTIQDYYAINFEGTVALAEQSAAAGVSRFIYISTAHVNGSESKQPFTETDIPSPSEAYAISKYRAENALLELANKTGLEVVIIRPPLVYGSGVKGNFAALIKIIKRGIPLPFGAIENKRSLVSLYNLIDMITVCMEHPSASNQIFLVSDGEDLSISDLIKRIAKTMGKNPRLFSIPISILSAAAILTGKKETAGRLLGSLQVNISKARDVLDWNPPFSIDESLTKTVKPFID